MLKTLVSACMFAVLASSIAVQAQTFDRAFFTFSQPVTLPGITLPAGTYQFRIVDETTSRKVVQVLDRHGMVSYATLHSLPVTREDMPSEPRVEFMETAAGVPPAVQAWWNAGRALGYEFIYPREQALRLAGRSTGSGEGTIAARTHQAETIAAGLGPVSLDSSTSVQ